MATAVQVESIWNGLTDNSGQPLAAGKVYTYAAGTTTPISLFTASDKSNSATNPLILDGNGKAQVWADGRYKFVVKTAADVTLYTLDNLLYGFDDTSVLLGGISTGSANAQTVSVPATVESYVNGQRITFIAGFTNTGATTLRFNALSSVNIVKGPTPSSLQAGDLLAGQLYSCTYYGGSFYLESTPTPADVQRSRSQVLSSVGGINTIIGALTPALTSYEAGQVFRFKAANASTAAVTLNINDLGAQAVQRYGVALVGGEIQANDMVEVVYDGTQFQLVNAVPNPLFIDRTNSRLGIGTTAPSTSLDVSSSASVIASVNRFSADAPGPFLYFTKSRGTTVGSNSIVQNADSLGALFFRGANGTAYNDGAIIAAEVDGTPGATNDMPGRLIFATTADGAGSVTERMRITSSGNVGIGTTAPSERLQIGSVSAITPSDSGGSVGSILGFNHYYSSGSKAITTGSRTVTVELGNNGGLLKSTTGTQTAGAALTGMNTYFEWGGFSDNITLSTAGTNRMRIDSTGQVGIGTMNPGAPLDVACSSAAAVGTLHRGRASDNIGVALFTQSDGSTETARIQAAPTSLSITKAGNNPIAISTNGSERLRVTGTGLVGIGTTGPTDDLHLYRASGGVMATSQSASLANGERAAVQAIGGPRTAQILAYKHAGIANAAGALYLDQQNNTAAYIWSDDSANLRTSATITHIGTTSGTVIGTQTSDSRLKDISTDPFPYGLSDVLAIEPVAFTFTNDPDQVERIGFSAQQVRPIVSEAVYDTNEPIVGEPEGAPTKLAMDYTALVPVLVKAIQQLEARVAALEA
jgi:hypothetical protein